MDISNVHTRIFRSSFKIFQGSFKALSRFFQGSFIALSRFFQGPFKVLLRFFQAFSQFLLRVFKIGNLISSLAKFVKLQWIKVGSDCHIIGNLTR